MNATNRHYFKEPFRGYYKRLEGRWARCQHAD